MTAKQQYFIHIREVAQRNAEYKRKMIERMKSSIDIVEDVYNCEHEFSEFDILLRRNWFLQDEDILELVWNASEEAFAKIIENVETYPEQVRNVLMDAFTPLKISEKVTLKIKELTTKDMLILQQTLNKEFDIKFRNVWQTYKKENGLTRPDGDLDDKYTDVYDTLQTIKKELENELNKPVSIGKYVPPSIRSKTPIVSPEVVKLQEKIKNLENEISQLKRGIVIKETIWENDKQLEYQSTILNKMFQL